MRNFEQCHIFVAAISFQICVANRYKLDKKYRKLKGKSDKHPDDIRIKSQTSQAKVRSGVKVRQKPRQNRVTGSRKKATWPKAVWPAGVFRPETNWHSSRIDPTNSHGVSSSLLLLLLLLIVVIVVVVDTSPPTLPLSIATHLRC